MDPNEGLSQRGQAVDAPQTNRRRARKTARLSATIQNHIGQHLRAAYEDVVQQPIPDRFLLLLQELDGKTRSQSPSEHKPDRASEQDSS